MEGRNVHIYSAQDRREVAGFWQHGRISISTFYTWLDVIVTCRTSWALYGTDPNVLQATSPALGRDDSSALPPGSYIISSLETQQPFATFITSESPRRRIYSMNDAHTPRSEDFTSRVRARDLRCCITGSRVPRNPRTGYNFVGFEAAHLFPLSEYEEFIRLGYDNLITDPWATTAEKKIDSVQQGFLCESTWHRRFDDYQIGIDPDDGYRITDFQDRSGPSIVDGRVFYINTDVEEEVQPLAELLRDHFRQCVLANLKTAAEPVRERIFDPEIDLGSGGFDLNNSFWRSQEGQAQFAAEMRGRLLGVQIQRQDQVD